MLLAWHRTASLIDQRVPALSFFPFFKLALFLTFKGPMLFYYCISNLKESCWLFMASHVAFLMASFTIAHTPFSIHQWKKWPFLKCRWPFSSWYFFLSSYSKDIPISHFIVAHCTILSIFYSTIILAWLEFLFTYVQVQLPRLPCSPGSPIANSMPC